MKLPIVSLIFSRSVVSSICSMGLVLSISMVTRIFSPQIISLTLPSLMSFPNLPLSSRRFPISTLISLSPPLSPIPTLLPSSPISLPTTTTSFYPSHLFPLLKQHLLQHALTPMPRITLRLNVLIRIPHMVTKPQCQSCFRSVFRELAKGRAVWSYVLLAGGRVRGADLSGFGVWSWALSPVSTMTVM
jgi:hypothetical protein